MQISVRFRIRSKPLKSRVVSNYIYQRPKRLVSGCSSAFGQAASDRGFHVLPFCHFFNANSQTLVDLFLNSRQFPH